MNLYKSMLTASSNEKKKIGGKKNLVLVKFKKSLIIILIPI